MSQLKNHRERLKNLPTDGGPGAGAYVRQKGGSFAPERAQIPRPAARAAPPPAAAPSTKSDQ
jgi:hypothetical protein